MKKHNLFKVLHSCICFMVLLMVLSVFTPVKAEKYQYVTVPNDPLNVKEYTLNNGLKVYMSVNKDQPRIQTYIAVRVGSKNDPAETTGLAHYFEHMMFKGTTHFGTTNWSAEKPLIQAIENEFEVYRKLTDSSQRAMAYHVIDSLSYEASKIAIPNEYDKLMSSIGSTGTNAGTSYDYTIYIEDIPSNQLSNWAKIQADRFENMVLRLFHTEIETVYEEKNMSLTNDNRRVLETSFETLFPNHPYGQHSVLGTQEDLKNPSVKNIREFFNSHYAPNNMAIVLAGDFDPDEAVACIEKYFGSMKAKPIPPFSFKQEVDFTEPVVKEVVGLEAECVFLSYPLPGAGTREAMLADMASSMLYNGQAGLIDLNLNQKQKVMFAYAGAFFLTDYGLFRVLGMPKTGQKLEEVRKIMLGQIDLLKEGKFSDWMLQATIDNMKYGLLKKLESNEDRGMYIADAYLNDIPWEKQVNYIDELSKVTKEDVMNFAKTYLGNNSLVIYKRQGEPVNIAKMQKPSITPIVVNRDSVSDFQKKVKESSKQVKPVNPVFVDYTKDIVRGKVGKEVELLYTKNVENPTFELVYLFEMGRNNDKIVDLAASYLNYLGTSKYSAEQIQQEFYKLACTFQTEITNDRIYIQIDGLSKNMGKAIALVESLMSDCQADAAALKNLKMDILKMRKDEKANQSSNVSALLDYAIYGKNSPTKNILSEKELNAVSSKELIEKLRNMFDYEHQILYYGPDDLEDVLKIFNKLHKTPKDLKPVPEAIKFTPLPTTENRIVFAPYKAKQSYCYTITRDDIYNKDLMPVIEMYNTYFGGGMNAIVFQELREKRSLAYSCGAFFKRPSRADGYFINLGMIATQNDKVADALTAFDDLYNHMPVSDIAYKLSLESTLSDIRTERKSKLPLLFGYLRDKKFGYSEDSRKVLYEIIPTLSLKDVENFNEKHIKNKPKTYMILGDEKDFDFNALEKKFGKVEHLTTEQIFGY